MEENDDFSYVLARNELNDFSILLDSMKKFILIGNDLESTSNLLNQIFVKKEILIKFYKAIDILPSFFQALFKCAFSDHQNKNLYNSTFNVLIYLVQNCSWCDSYLIDFNFHITERDLIISNNFPNMKKISIFLIKIIQKEVDAFHSLFDIKLTEALINEIHENDLDNKIWPLQCLQIVVSLPYFDDNQSLELILTTIEEFFNIEDIDIRLLDASYSLLASVFLSLCDDSLKERATITLYINSCINLFNQDNERICISILTYLINLLYYNNDSTLSYLINHSILTLIISKYTDIIQSDSITTKMATFCANCLTQEKCFVMAMKQLSETNFLPINLMEIVNKGTYSMQYEIAIYCCKMINMLSPSQYDQYINPAIINFLLDQLIIDDFDLEANIICTLIHYVKQIELNVENYHEEIDAITDPTISDRLNEIIETNENDQKQLSNAASLLLSLIFDLNTE